MDVEIQPSVVPTGGLVGEWKLEGNVNDTKNGFNATLFGSPPYITAKIGQGLDLTGNGTGGQGGKYAEMPLNTTLNELQEGAAYSISAWFNPASIPSGTAPSQFWMVVGKTNTQAIGIVYNSNQKFAARHYLDGNLLQLTTSAAQFAVNQWHHAVAVVTKGSATVAGSLKLYVNGQLVDTDTWTGGTPAKDFGTTAKWRIGKSDTDWSAHGRVDQVRFYNVALDSTDVRNLFEETAPSIFRFPVGMSKDQTSDLGTDAFFYNPDGKRSSIGTSMEPTLSYARQHEARVIMTVTGADNERLRADSTKVSAFVKSKWMTRFNNAAAAISPATVRDYLKDGTLIGIYVIDEPWVDFTEASFTFETLDSLCQHVKASWPWAPCIARIDNTIISEHTPAGYTYKYLDAGWAQTTEGKVSRSPNGTARSYFEEQLASGDSLGLGLWYGFNLINYATTTNRPGCSPSFETGKCAMTGDDLRAVANAIEAIGSGKGCGVSGWYLEKDAGAKRDYFLNGDMNLALRYLWNHTAGRSPAIQPGPCNIRGDLPAP